MILSTIHLDHLLDDIALSFDSPMHTLKSIGLISPAQAHYSVSLRTFGEKPLTNPANLGGVCFLTVLLSPGDRGDIIASS